MSEENKIDIKYLQLLVLQESENDAMQKLDSNLYNSISKFIGDLKSEECDGIDAKISSSARDIKEAKFEKEFVNPNDSTGKT